MAGKEMKSHLPFLAVTGSRPFMRAFTPIAYLFDCSHPYRLRQVMMWLKKTESKAKVKKR
jgi:hypothetical protein